MSNLIKLINQENIKIISSHELDDNDFKRINIKSNLINEFKYFLKEINGFFAFEMSLHVFPIGDNNHGQELGFWNASVWKEAYIDNLENILFFSENIFGEQFCLKDDSIFKFDPETAQLEEIAKTFDDWAGLILEDTDFFTGFSLAQKWQKKFGPLQEGKRLIPKKPFVCGGEFEINNLFMIDALKGMLSRASLSNQIRDLPDGAKIEFKIIEDS